LERKTTEPTEPSRRFVSDSWVSCFKYSPLKILRNPNSGSLKVIENNTIWCTTYDFLLIFHSNYGSMSGILGDIQCRNISRPWNPGEGSI